MMVCLRFFCIVWAEAGLLCERHSIPYDPSWSRGTINNTINRYVVEVGVCVVCVRVVCAGL
jgi:hypothetical protein